MLVQAARVFTTIRVIPKFMIMLVFSACTGPFVQVTTTVDSRCETGRMGQGDSEDGPGISCGGSNKQELTYPTQASSISNIIPINPTNGTIPPNAVCSSANPSVKSYKCKSGIPGQSCGIIPGKKCKDTYNIGTTVCDCMCM